MSSNPLSTLSIPLSDKGQLLYHQISPGALCRVHMAMSNMDGSS